MTTDRAIRASDQDREHVVEILRTHYAEGRLTLEEFDERMAAAYAGKTWGDLLDLTNDLPANVRLGADLPASSVANQRPADQQPPQRFMPLLPLLFAGLAVAWFAAGGMGFSGHHRHYSSFFYPIWLLVIVLVIARRGACSRRGRGGRFR